MMNGPFQKISLLQTGLLQCGWPGQFTLKPLAEVRVAEFKVGLLHAVSAANLNISRGWGWKMAVGLLRQMLMHKSDFPMW